MTCSRRVRAGLRLHLHFRSRLQHAHRAVACVVERSRFCADGAKDAASRTATERAAALAARATSQEEEEAAEQCHRNNKIGNDA